jgi:hypothetical protein
VMVEARSEDTAERLANHLAAVVAA